MLVLARRVGEVLCIGPDIEVEVVEIRRDGSVRLGVTAPKTVVVYRKGMRKRSVLALVIRAANAGARPERADLERGGGR